MRQRIFAFVLGLGICAVCAYPLQAQTAGTANPHYNKQLFLFASLGMVSGPQVGPNITVAPYKAFQLGGTAELFVFKGLAVGAELAISPKQLDSEPVTYTYRTFSGSEATATYPASGVGGWGSLGLAYHFKGLSANGKFVPFIAAGAGVFSRDGLAESINYGGGFNIWRSKHRGWRLEYRKHVVADGGYDTHLRSVRVGLVLR